MKLVVCGYYLYISVWKKTQMSRCIFAELFNINIARLLLWWCVSIVPYCCAFFIICIFFHSFSYDFQKLFQFIRHLKCFILLLLADFIPSMSVWSNVLHILCWHSRTSKPPVNPSISNRKMSEGCKMFIIISHKYNIFKSGWYIHILHIYIIYDKIRNHAPTLLYTIYNVYTTLLWE